MSDDTPKHPAPIAIANLTATSATSDEELVASWVANLRSEHSRINFRTTADRFLAALGASMCRATVEDVRQALETITAELAPSSSRQIVLRVKSLLSYGHRVGYLPFNAGAVIRVHGEARAVAQRGDAGANDPVFASPCHPHARSRPTRSERRARTRGGLRHSQPR
jgi:integrase/recombinase XerD